MSPNMERFNELVGYIFAEMQDEFPHPIGLGDWQRFAEKMGAKPGAYFNSLDPNWESATVGDGELFGPLFKHTLNWLADEGLIRSYDRGTFYIPTAKALAALNHTPDSITPSFGSKLGQAVTTGASEAGKATIISIVTGLLTYAAAKVGLQHI